MKVMKVDRKKQLIDVEQAKRATYEEIFWTESEQAVVRNFLAKLPKVDATEVVHGAWVWKDLNGDGSLVLCCSACLGSDGARETAHFCSECGAKMDGGAGCGKT